jgi:hypothetical protein
MPPITLPPPPIQSVYCFVEDDKIQPRSKKNSKTLSYLDYLNTQIKHRFVDSKPIFRSKLDMEKFSPLIIKFAEDTFKHFKDKANDKEYLESISKAFVISSIKLSKLNFEKIGVESNKDSVYFFAKKGNLNIHYEIYINHQLEKEQFEVVLNIFQDRKQFLSISGGENFIFNKLISTLTSLQH